MPITLPLRRYTFSVPNLYKMEDDSNVKGMAQLPANITNTRETRRVPRIIRVVADNDPVGRIMILYVTFQNRSN